MATRRRRRVNDGERSALGNAIARVGDAWAELSGDRRQTDEYFVSNAGLIANVPLQMLIYFNSIYSVAWGALWISLYVYKYSYWKADLVSAFLNPILFAIWALIEPLRLWFGNSGNLSEKVGNLAAFFLLTLFPQLFAHLLFLGAPSFLLPFEAISGALMLVLLAAEAYVSYHATRTLIHKSTAQFQLAVESDEPVLDAQAGM